MDSIILRDENQLSQDILLLIKVFPFVWLALAGFIIYLSGFIALFFIVPMILFAIPRFIKALSAVDVFVNYTESYFELKNLNEKIIRKNFHDLKSYTKNSGRFITLHFDDNSSYRFISRIDGSRTKHSIIVLKILDRIIETNKVIII